MSDKIPYEKDNFMVCQGFAGSGMSGCIDNNGTGIGIGTGPEENPCDCVVLFMMYRDPQKYKLYCRKHYINYGYDRA